MTIYREFVAVFAGNSYESRHYDGLVVDGVYHSKTELRGTQNMRLKEAHLLVKKLVREDSYCFSDAPFDQERDGDEYFYYYDFPVPAQLRKINKV